MRRLLLLRRSDCDVLIFDRVNISSLRQCVPPRYKTTCLDMRNSFPILLDADFILRILRRIPCVLVDRTLMSSLAYLWMSALLETLAPRLILSCADNNPLIARFADEHPTTPVLLVQNALRDTAGSIMPRRSLPIYLAFGEIERAIFQTLGIHCREYRAIGSLKLGLALTKLAAAPECQSSLSFISHFRPEMLPQNQSGTDEIPLQQIIEKNQRILFQLCREYSADNNLLLMVITKSRDDQTRKIEKEYFENLAAGVFIKFIWADKESRELATYLSGLTSELIVHPASTLGFELLAAGRKVILGATIDPNLIDAWGIQQYVNILPELLRLQSGDRKHFYECCNSLRDMSDHQYRAIIQPVADTLVSMPKDSLPHQTIGSLVDEILGQRSKTFS